MTFAFTGAALAIRVIAGVAAVALLACVLIVLDRRRVVRLHRVVDASLAPRLAAGADAKMRRPLTWLPLLGFTALLLAMLQPHWGRDWVRIERVTRDILLLVDLSESMNAERPVPSRLARARQKAEALMDTLPGDRFGIVAFSGAATLQSPLTHDHNYVRAVLSDLDTDLISAEGSDLEAAVEEAEHVFEEDARNGGTASRHTRAVVLMTDGEAPESGVEEAARRLGRHTVLLILGIGDPQGTPVSMPEWMITGGHSLADGTVRLSRLDEDRLTALALAAGGVYVRSTPGNDDIRYFARELSQLAGSRRGEENRERRVNRYRWPLTAALVCFGGKGLWLVLLPWLGRRSPRGEGGVKHV